MQACKKRLAMHAAAYLESVNFDTDSMTHTCIVWNVDAGDATVIEHCVDPSLPPEEEGFAAYVRGWLEKKCKVTLSDENPEVSDIIKEVSKDYLQLPHQSSFDLV
ncbi:hypothetical protein PoB_007164100 [Plakobranchus ocellatus]|uniref:Uncharacterized protein n=1 Tax=Plakobranchus ocellatus TaxID=259542 RepID=A0AAV4DMN9_9GAST|nr:hypothetical protein PoB_007164100 [Plakobranchus ocellatus]